MSFLVQAPHIITQRGPGWWLAWMSHRPGTVYRGRSQAEAVGRMMLSPDADGLPLPDVLSANGWPQYRYEQCLSAVQLAEARHDVEQHRKDQKYRSPERAGRA